MNRVAFSIGERAVIALSHPSFSCRGASRPLSFSEGGRMRRLRARGKLKEPSPVSEIEPETFISAGVDEDVFWANEKLNSSRSRKERKDSVTPEILRERLEHLQRISTSVFETAEMDTRKLLEMGLGQKKRKHLFKRNDDSAGAGGTAQHIGSARKDFPVFKHVLPEIALAGHTNSGKSTLVNALAGINPKNGPARVSDRAGWTDLVCFYQIGKLPPLLNLVDLPGYGHAIADSKAVQEWSAMIRRYFTNRHVISRCCVLVDSCRGLCREDRALIRMLHKSGVQVQVVLTKADLLPTDMLACSIAAVKADVSELLDAMEGIVPVPKVRDIGDVSAECRGISSGDGDEKISSVSIDGCEEMRHNSDRDVSASNASNGTGPVEVFDSISVQMKAGSDEAPTDDVVCYENEDDLFANAPANSGNEVGPIPEVSSIGNKEGRSLESSVDKGDDEVNHKTSKSNRRSKNEIDDDDVVVGNITKAGRWPLRLPGSQLVVAVSAATGAGVNELWRQIKECARATVSTRSPNGVVLPGHAVLEHVNSSLLRRKLARKRMTLGDVVAPKLSVKRVQSMHKE